MIRPSLRFGALFIAILLLVPLTSQATFGDREAGAQVSDDLRSLLSKDAGIVPVIISFEAPPTDEDAVALGDAGFLPPYVRYRVVDAVATAGDRAAIEAIAKNPRVTYIEHDAVIPYTLNKAKSVGRADVVWDATYESLGAVHTGGITGRGIGVAVVDSGIDATHPDLIWKPLAEAQGIPATTIANFKLVGRDSVGASGIIIPVGAFLEANVLGVDVADSDTTGGHGTHVAGSVAGTGRASDGKYVGAAPGANLIGYGAGETLVVSSGLAAFDHIHQNHEALNIRIVSNSWGGPGDWNPNSVVTKAIRKLANEDGLLMIFASGNDGGSGASIQTSVWANIPEAMSIANYYDTTGWLDGSSSRGKKDLARTWPDLAAPGTQIISTAATAGPVSYYGTTQDALITILEGTGEPWVVSTPAASPLLFDDEVDGQGVVVGPYTSMSGTSMATPFVSGVAALILEANPALTWQEVRAILTATANMPPGRFFETDGFAIGAGVVDAAEGVAVALKMKDGYSLEGALRFALVDDTGSPAALNMDLPRRLAITSQADGDSVTGASVTVSGDFASGKVTSRDIPYYPVPDVGEEVSPITGNARIYQAGALDPFAAGGHMVVPGTFVDLSVRTIVASGGYTLGASGFTATHSVMRDGVIAYGPFAATWRADGANWQSTSEWTIPEDAPAGSYVFRAEVTLASSGETFVMGKLPFSIGAPDAPGVPEPQAAPRVGVPVPSTGAGTSSTFLSADFESGSTGWTVSQNGFGNGLLTSWNFVDATTVGPHLSWDGSHSGDKFFNAGLFATSPYLVGLYYTDNADVSLVSPEIDLTAASGASLSYWRSGGSEEGYDFLTVEVKEVGKTGWTPVDQASGAAVSWTESVVSLSAYAGLNVQVRFRFTSDLYTLPETDFSFIGWNIDDVVVSGVQGTPVVVIEPEFESVRTFGVGALEASFEFDAASNVPITSYEIDFGDGSPIHLAADKGTVKHTYAVGEYVATLTVTAGGESVSLTIPVDVAPIGMVQARIAGGTWTDAGAADAADTTFSAVLGLAGVAAGPATIEVRHFDGNGYGISHTVDVVVA